VDADLFGIEEAGAISQSPPVQAALGYFDEAKQLLAIKKTPASSPHM
jgi:hypothetical protein